MTTYPSTSARSALAASATDRAPGFLLRAPLFVPRPPAVGAVARFRVDVAPFASVAAGLPLAPFGAEVFGSVASRADFTSFAGFPFLGDVTSLACFARFGGFASFAGFASFGGFTSFAGFALFGGFALFAGLASFAGFVVRLDAGGFGAATSPGDRADLVDSSAFAPLAGFPAFGGFTSFATAGALPAPDGVPPFLDAPAVVRWEVARGAAGRGDADRADVTFAALPGVRARFEPAATCPVAPFSSVALSGRAPAAAAAFRRVAAGLDAASFFPASRRAVPDRDAADLPAVFPRGVVVVRPVDAAAWPARDASRRALSVPRDPPADRAPAPRLPFVSGFPDF